MSEKEKPNQGLVRQLINEGWARHSPGCSRTFGPQYRCRCGWSDYLADIGIEELVEIKVEPE